MTLGCLDKPLCGRFDGDRLAGSDYAQVVHAAVDHGVLRGVKRVISVNATIILVVMTYALPVQGQVG